MEGKEQREQIINLFKSIIEKKLRFVELIKTKSVKMIELLATEEDLSVAQYEIIAGAVCHVLHGKNIRMIHFNGGGNDIWMAVHCIGKEIRVHAAGQTKPTITQLNGAQPEIKRQFQLNDANWEPDWKQLKYTFKEEVSNRMDRFVHVAAIALRIGMGREATAFRSALVDGGNTQNIRNTIVEILTSGQLPDEFPWQ